MEINKKTAILIGLIGVLFGIGGLVAYKMKPDLVWLYTVLEALAVVHLIVFFVTHFEVLKAVSQQRSTQLGFNASLMVVIFVTILSIVNFIIAQHEVRIDLSLEGAYTLSPQTISVLKEVKQDIKVSGFFGQNSKKVDSAKDLFENYKHETSKFKYELIDPDRKPAIAKQYGVTEYDTVVLESNGQSATLTNANITEQELTSALIRLSRKSKKQIYFIEGHGEHAIDDQDRGGYSVIKTALEKQGFDVKKLVLLSEKAVPGDAAVVIMGGPKTEYTGEEKASLRTYLDDGGQLIALLDPMTQNGLEGFFSEWGVLLKNDLILDPSSGLGPAVPVVGPGDYLSHEVTKEFDLATFYSLARSVSFDQAKAGEYRFDSFIQTNPNTWATEALATQIAIDPNRDQKGPIVMGGVFSKGSGKAISEEDKAADTGKKMRIAIMGDSDFAANEMVRAAGNGDFFQNMVSWLADEGDLVSIRPKETAGGTLLLSAPQQTMIFYSSVVILPIGTLLFGLIVSRKRRYL
jgi:ABC-type uncharacterized transport system involved in gliding motility auxiliary subunit